MRETIDGHRIQHIIATSEMSTVYLARHKNLDRPIVVKVLEESLAGDLDFRERFEQEARTLADLEHGNVVRVLDSGEEDGLPFIVMEHVDGVDLRGVLDTLGGGLPPALALIVLQEVVAGLETAHDQGLIHRDVKPGNVMISRTGEVKVLDFGLVKRQGSDGSDEADGDAQETRILGTRGYMAPEQRHGGPMDARADVFALGRLAHEMLAGERPSEASGYGDGLDAPGTVGRTIKRMTAVDPDDRFASMKEVAAALSEGLARATDRERVVDPRDRRAWLARLARNPRTAVAEFRARPPARWPMLAAAAGLLAVAATLAALRFAPGEFRFALTTPEDLSAADDVLSDLDFQVLLAGTDSVLVEARASWRADGPLASVSKRVPAAMRRELDRGRVRARVVATGPEGVDLSWPLERVPTRSRREIEFRLTGPGSTPWSNGRSEFVFAVLGSGNDERVSGLALREPDRGRELEELEKGVYRAAIPLPAMLADWKSDVPASLSVVTARGQDAFLDLDPRWFAKPAEYAPRAVRLRRAPVPVPPRAPDHGPPPGPDPGDSRPTLQWTLIADPDSVARGTPFAIEWRSEGIPPDAEVGIRLVPASGIGESGYRAAVSNRRLEIPTSELAPGIVRVRASLDEPAGLPAGEWTLRIVPDKVPVRLRLKLGEARLAKGTVWIGDEVARQDEADRFLWMGEVLPGRYDVRVVALRVPDDWRGHIDVGADGWDGTLTIE